MPLYPGEIFLIYFPFFSRAAKPENQFRATSPGKQSFLININNPSRQLIIINLVLFNDRVAHINQSDTAE